MSISHQTILNVLNEVADVAKKLNKDLVLEGTNCAIFDEIFQGSDLILGFANPISGLIYLKNTNSRTGEDWKDFLLELKDLGLNPESVNTDGGNGLLKGLSSVFDKANQMRDFFHVIAKIYKAKRAMEGICYALIHRIDISIFDEEKQRNIVLCDNAISIFDEFEKFSEKMRKACYLAHEDGVGKYTTWQELEMIIEKCHSQLDAFLCEVQYHKKIYDAKTYLENGFNAIIAYKKSIEEKVIQHFGNQYYDLVMEYFMPMVEYMTQYQRAYESKERMKYWGEKIAKIRASMRGSKIVNQGEVDAAINHCWKIITSRVKSNSYIEAVNSVIRSHLNSYQSIPKWFCQIFTYFWNHRVFKRGKRAGYAPIELQNNQNTNPDWIKKIVDNFPFDKLSSELPLHFNIDFSSV